MTYIPNSRARVMVDMLFSQDPAMTQRAINALRNEPNGRQFVRSLTGAVGIMSTANGGDQNAQPENQAPEPSPTVVDTPAAEAAPAEPGAEPMDPAASPYAMNLKQIEETENPDLLALIDRQFHQESRTGQFNPDGSVVTSPKGAIGAAQVMPHTGPEAAVDAGLPWDETAYRGDPVYNKLLGIGYMSKLLRKHNGDVARALASYNAGPDRVDHALSAGDNWLTQLPPETQDYVQRIAS
jgi:soluble lytic murein transglycosylase-like protein